MHKIVTFLIIGCYSLPAFSQSYTISLKKQTFQTPFKNIWIDQVIDARKEKQYIGFVQRGISNTKIKAVLEDGLESGLRAFFNSNLKMQSNTRPLILRIDQFDISESTGFSSELGQVEIKAQLFLKTGDDTYFLVKDFETLQTVKGIEVTAKHDNNIANAFTLLFGELTEEDLISALQNNPLSLTEAISRNSIIERNNEFLEQQRFAILNEKPKEGFYESFLNFRDNTPKSGSNIYLKKKKKNNTLEIIPYYSDNNQKLKDDFWGFCHNDTVYIQVKKEYFPLIFENNSVYFYAYKGSDPNYYYNPGVGVAFGLVGGAIAGAAASADAGQSEKYELNLLNGDFGNKAFNPNPDLNPGNKSKLVIVRYPKDEIDRSVIVTINDTTQLSIGLHEFTEIDFSSPFITMWICVDAEKENCINYLPETDTTKYYTVSLDNRKGVEELNIAEIQRDVADSFINRAKRQAKKAK